MESSAPEFFAPRIGVLIVHDLLRPSERRALFNALRGLMNAFGGYSMLSGLTDRYLERNPSFVLNFSSVRQAHQFKHQGERIFSGLIAEGSLHLKRRIIKRSMRKHLRQ